MSDTDPRKQPIPQLSFLNTPKTDIGFEIIRLDDLYERVRRVKHAMWQPYRVTFFNVLFVSKGRGTHTIDFQPHAFEDGTLLFVSKGQVHAFERVEPAGYLILFTEQFFLRNLSAADTHLIHTLYNYHLHQPRLRLDDSAPFAALCADMHSEFHAEGSFAREDVLRLQLKLFLLKAERLRRAHTQRMDNDDRLSLFIQFQNRVEQQYQQSRNALDYAQQLGVSYKHLNAVCKTLTGTTAKAFIDQLVVLEIKRLLAVTDGTTQELSYQIGFDEPTNFVKYFKRHTGQSPQQFRRSLIDL